MRTFHLDVSLHRHSLLELMSYQITDFPLNLDALHYPSDKSPIISVFSFVSSFVSFLYTQVFFSLSLLPDSSSVLCSFSESVRVRTEWSGLDRQELRRDFRGCPLHSWTARSGVMTPSGSESASDPAFRPYLSCSRLMSEQYTVDDGGGSHMPRSANAKLPVMRIQVLMHKNKKECVCCKASQTP